MREQGRQSVDKASSYSVALSSILNNKLLMVFQLQSQLQILILYRKKLHAVYPILYKQIL